jgi:hypothetical protein
MLHFRSLREAKLESGEIASATSAELIAAGQVVSRKDWHHPELWIKDLQAIEN